MTFSYLTELLSKRLFVIRSAASPDEFKNCPLITSGGTTGIPRICRLLLPLYLFL